MTLPAPNKSRPRLFEGDFLLFDGESFWMPPPPANTSAPNSLSALTDLEFLELILRQFAERPHLQLIAGIVSHADGALCLMTTAPEIPQPAQLHAIVDKLEDGTSWTRLVKRPD